MLWQLDGAEPGGKLLPGSDKGTFHAAFSGDGRYLALGQWDNSVQVWNLTSLPYHAFTLDGHAGYNPHNGYAYFVAISHDGRRVLSLSADDTGRIGGKDGPLSHRIESHRSRTLHADFSPDGQLWTLAASLVGVPPLRREWSG
ncbi:hypothetical protein [Sphingobium sp. MK2]|uniref:WD40 repeat domain-containing protein n=1 Tax=Sphingobium sp. MK2 TaxID=3116540 RepID=UPI0032E35C0A